MKQRIKIIILFACIGLAFTLFLNLLSMSVNASFQIKTYPMLTGMFILIGISGSIIRDFTENN
jgi:hypothetical protein